MKHCKERLPKIIRIEIDENSSDCSFYFEDSEEPWSFREFSPSKTRDYLEDISESILNPHVRTWWETILWGVWLGLSIVGGVYSIRLFIVLIKYLTN